MNPYTKWSAIVNSCRSWTHGISLSQLINFTAYLQKLANHRTSQSQYWSVLRQPCINWACTLHLYRNRSVPLFSLQNLQFVCRITRGSEPRQSSPLYCCRISQQQSVLYGCTLEESRKLYCMEHLQEMGCCTVHGTLEENGKLCSNMPSSTIRICYTV